jgi:glycosyltransferase involved in cell wall biosynthesis
MNRPRVLLVIGSAAPGGGELTFRHLVEYVDTDRFDVRVVCPPWPEVEQLTARRGLQLTRLALPGRFEPRSVRALAGIVADHRPDIVHSHLLLADIYAAAASFVTRPTALVSTVQGLNYLWHLESRPLRRLRYRLMTRVYRSVYARFDAVVTCSAALREAICREPWIRVRRDKASVIYNSVDLSRQVPHARAGAPAAADGVRHIVTVANFAPVKGHAFLLDALARLGDSPAVRCSLVGDGPLRPAIEAQARARGLADRVEFLGWRQDVADIVGSADLFVFPSLWDGLGIAVLEAMALEVPVVAFAAGGVPEAVRDGETGILVNTGDAAALAEGIRRGLLDEELRRRVVAKARAHVEAVFDARLMASAYGDWYESVLAGRDRRPRP